MAGYQGRAERADRRADRLGQDAGGVSRRDRRLVRQGIEGQSPLPDETQIVYVSPLKALSNDIQQEPRSAARRHPRGIAGARAARCRDPQLGAHRRHAARRARRGCAGCRRTSSSRRPNRCTSCSAPNRAARMLATAKTVIVDEIHAVAPNKRGSHLALSLERLDALCGGRCSASACRRRRSRSRRSPAFWSAPGRRRTATGMHDHRHRPSSRARSRARTAVLAARSGDVGRGLGGGLRPPRRADPGAPHDAGLRQHAPHGRARDPRTVGAARRRARRRASRQPRRRSAGSTPKQRLKARRAEGAGRDRLARTRHRHRRGRSGLPDRLAALDRGFLQRVGRSGHAVGGMPKGRLFPLSRDELVECAALLDSVGAANSTGSAIPRAAARRARAADRRRGRCAGVERGRAVRAVPPRVAVSRSAARGFRGDRARCWPKASARGAAGAAR